MIAPPPPVRLFVGSSSEGRDVARNLQVELQRSCDVVLWEQGVFEPGGYTLDSLLSVASKVDFAVLVAMPDDATISRGVTEQAARDNIVLEFGLFAGVLGRERVYLLPTDKLKLPTDVLGLTRLPYHPQSDGNHQAALTGAVLQIEERIGHLGRLHRQGRTDGADTSNGGLEQELALVCANALAQGWMIRTNNVTTLRLRSPKGKAFTMSKGQPEETRTDLRRFAAELKAGGLRVNRSVLRPVAESPF